ncbi:hypothetical protein ACOMHN_043947 [Nucella lapillus]
MKPDDIYRLIRGDSLILMLGERLFEKRDIEEHTSGQIGGRLRELGRLLQVLRKNSKMTVSNLKAALDPANFDILIACVRELAQFDISSHMYKKGSLALKVGYALRKCSQLLAAQAIKSNDKVILDKVSRFEQLYSANWYDRISACAAQSVGRAQMNKLLLLPTISDVEMVNRLLEKDCKSDSYPTLAKATLALITIFNRKRGGEVQRMKVNDFKLKPKMSRVDSEILQGLTETEKKLAAILQRVEIRGKFNRPVPILLTPVMIESIQKLLQMRTSMKLDSPYLFITPNGSNPYRGSDTIRQYAEAAEIGDDALFTATNLRKQLATLSQAMEVTKLNQDQLAKFLGHDIRVHRSIYRQPLEVMQKAKVASVLFQINRGHDLPDEITDSSIQKEEIFPDDDEVPVTELNAECPSENQEICVASNEQKNLDRKNAEPPEISSPAQTSTLVQQKIMHKHICASAATGAVVERNGTSMQMAGKKRKKRSTDSSQTKKPRGHAESGSDFSDSELFQCHSASGRKRFRRVLWTEEEKEALKKQLQPCFVLNKVPQKHEAELAILNEPCLGRRSWKDIKYQVYNLLKKQV